jgi:hypothetical protein
MSRPKCHTLTDADDTVGYDDTIRDWARRTWTGLKDRNTCRSRKRGTLAQQFYMKFTESPQNEMKCTCTLNSRVSAPFVTHVTCRRGHRELRELITRKRRELAFDLAVVLSAKRNEIEVDLGKRERKNERKKEQSSNRVDRVKAKNEMRARSVRFALT